MLELAWPFSRFPVTEPGDLVLRGLHQMLRSIPFERNPAVELVDPPASACHTVVPVEVPIGDEVSPGRLFVPKAATGGTVLLVHGTSADQPYPYYQFLRQLLASGIKVLIFSLDGHGENPRTLCWPDITEDVPAALAFLRQRPDVDPERIGMLGVSLGGACLLHAARSEDVQALVTVSTPVQLRLSGWDKLKEAAGFFAPDLVAEILDASPNCMLEFLAVPMRMCDAAGSYHELDLLDDRVLAIVDSLLDALEPIRSARLLGETPLLVINGAWDHPATCQQATEIYAAASGPKELCIVPRRNHFTLMTSLPAAEAAAGWFQQWL